MKVLVTGGTGFIGSHLVELLLARGDDVRCVAKDRLNVVMLDSPNVEVILGDLNNGLGWDRILDGVERVYHLAGVTKAARASEYYEGNCLATRRLLESCFRFGPNLKRFLYVSSQAAVGPSLDGQPVTERSPYHPVTHYGRSKMMAELEILKVRDQLPVTIIRPSAVYGPRERDWLEYFKYIKQGIQPLMGFGKKFLSLIHSDDLVSGIIAAAESSQAEGETYFLGSETTYSTEDIGDVVARILNRRTVRVRIPHVLVRAVGMLLGISAQLKHKAALFNYQKAIDSLQSAWICSVEKAKSHFGFRQCVALEDGMLGTCRWYQEHGWL
ncbi:MAG: NAD-dependent epimerase/dehydratase family protein [Bacteroidota bacterium]